MARHPWIRSTKYPDVWTAVYRLYDATNRLLYVGIAFNYLARWKAHAKKSWWADVVRKDVVWYDNRLTAAWEETKAILGESPVHNDHPGLELLSFFVFRIRRGGRWIDIPQPEMLTHKFFQDEAVRNARDNQAHVAVAREDELVAALVPVEWYRRACEALKDPTDL